MAFWYVLTIVFIANFFHEFPMLIFNLFKQLISQGAWFWKAKARAIVQYFSGRSVKQYPCLHYLACFGMCIAILPILINLLGGFGKFTIKSFSWSESIKSCLQTRGCSGMGFRTFWRCSGTYLSVYLFYFVVGCCSWGSHKGDEGRHFFPFLLRY